MAKRKLTASDEVVEESPAAEEIQTIDEVVEESPAVVELPKMQPVDDGEGLKKPKLVGSAKPVVKPRFEQAGTNNQSREVIEE
jgi:hypothetical protein